MRFCDFYTIFCFVLYTEIGKILDIDRLFTNNKHSVIGCSFNSKSQQNTDLIIKYLTDNAIITPIIHEEDDKKYDDKRGKISDHKQNSKSFVNIFRKKSSSNKNKNHEVIMIFGLDKVGKSRLLDSFGFGKRCKTSIAIFEAETLKCGNCEFHAWNYEQRSWPMCKSFFINCSLVIFVIDATKIDLIQSEKKTVWTVELYLKMLLGDTMNNKDNNGAININTNRNRNKSKSNKAPPFVLRQQSNPFAVQRSSPFTMARSKSYDEDDEKFGDGDNGSLTCPFLFYLNKTDSDHATLTVKDLEDRLQLSRLMKSKGIKHFVQECSVKNKKGVYDGLIWCYMNGILTSIPNIKQYAMDNDIKLPSIPNYPSSLKQGQTK